MKLSCFYRLLLGFVVFSSSSIEAKIESRFALRERCSNSIIWARRMVGLDSSTRLDVARSLDLKSVNKIWSSIAPSDLKEFHPVEVMELKPGASGRGVYKVKLQNKTDRAWNRELVLMHFDGQHPDNFRLESSYKVLKKAGDESFDVPELYSFHPHGFALVEFASPTTLKDRVEGGGDLVALYKKTLNGILPLHRSSKKDYEELNFSRKPAREQLAPGFDEELYREKEQLYFLEYFVGLHRGDPKSLLNLKKDQELIALAKELGRLPKYMVHRDFQSENVLMGDNHIPQIIDHQSMREGRPEYDVASLLYDPYVDITPAQRETLMRHYYDQAVAQGAPFIEGRDYSRWRVLVGKLAAQRLMQAIGAYSKLGHSMGREEYLPYIDGAVDRLKTVLGESKILPNLRRYLDGE